MTAKAVAMTSKNEGVITEMDETPKAKVLLSGLGFGESPRWHEGRLWFAIGGHRKYARSMARGEAK